MEVRRYINIRVMYRYGELPVLLYTPLGVYLSTGDASTDWSLASGRATGGVHLISNVPSLSHAVKDKLISTSMAVTDVLIICSGSFCLDFLLVDT